MALCIPPARGVPGLSNQPPNWLGTALPIPDDDQLDDPRWRGAVSRGFGGGGVGEEVDFRAVHHEDGGTSALYLSWRVRFDPSLDNNTDRLYVGFERGGADPLIVRVEPYDSSGSDLTADPVAGVQALTLNADGTATAMADPPDWIGPNTRAWLTTSPVTWAVQMRVPISAAPDQGLDLGAPFRFWFSVHVQTPGGVVEYSSPRDAPDITTNAALDDVYPALADWEEAHRSTGTSDPACPTTGGVSLQTLDVGTTNTPSSRISYDGDVAFGSRPPNTFFARPRNDTGAAIPAGGVAAHFRIANWGSVADGAAPWDTIPGAAAVASTAPIPDGGQADQANLAFDWTLNDADIAPIESGAITGHQCVFVELSGPGLDFSTRSVYRNMDFVEASTFRRDAEISVVGLAPLAAAPRRDVYLAVETRNMPARVDPSPQDGQSPQDRRKPSAGARLDLAATAPGGLPRPPKGGYTREFLDRAMPVYRVHAYHDTGDTIVVDGRRRPVLRSQSAFGYYVHHQGPLEGWQHRLDGAERIAPDFYRLGVPHGGTATVRTTIEAVETSGPRGCSAWFYDLIQWFSARLGL